MTEGLLLTAVWRNGGCSTSFDSFVVGSSVVLRLNFCAKIRHCAKRQNVVGNPIATFYIDSKSNILTNPITGRLTITAHLQVHKARYKANLQKSCNSANASTQHQNFSERQNKISELSH